MNPEGHERLSKRAFCLDMTAKASFYDLNVDFGVRDCCSPSGGLGSRHVVPMKLGATARAIGSVAP